MSKKTLIAKGLQIKGIYGREMLDTWYKMMTIEFSIQEYEKVFATILIGESGKIIMNWD